MKTRSKQLSLLSLSIFMLASCASPTGTYELLAFDKDNQPIITKAKIIASGSGIYTARNAICINNPLASVRIIDTKTKQDLAGESPYKCK